MGVEAALAPAGSRSWSHQYRFQRSDGSYATVVGRGWVEAGEDGTAIRIVGGITDVTARVEAERELRRSREQLRALSARLQTLREDERTHIAREIHDELGQLLTGLRMNLRWAEDQLAAGVAGLALNSVLDRVVEATELTDQVLSAVRRIATELRPSVLDALGLFQALRLEAVRFEQQSGIPCHLSLPEVSPQLGPETRTAVFRIFQEALTNVTRHAQATRVEASFRTEDERGVVEVKDNGRGLGATRTTEGPSLGLLGMQERAAAVYGSVVFKEAPGGGTVVQLGFPLRTNPEPGASRAAPQS
jgi:signal transduction histidine kinase